ncbi:glycoside hydrolase family 2 sugar binding protein [Russula earlei]|uniref:Glycoside hydrolase family 2 sugar binding protein n=1 Tax=Russula earlei TaxID=71964 RepID=A0ACC0TVI1_9AGAM|nr:glycoside hydrolase family 2 sugar binding protein [Russula earlei]
MQASVSKQGITADLEAMKQNGIAGAYLMPIKGVANPPLMQPPIEQLTPAFWQMVRFAMQEADRLGLQLGMHFCDGFAIGGGPWITPALSMQKLVWTTTYADGGQPIHLQLLQPAAYKNYYEDIAILAFPSHPGFEPSSVTTTPIVTTSKGTDVSFLASAESKESFKSDDSCWIQYAFTEPFTCRSITIRAGNNYEAQRLLLLESNDGVHFDTVTHLQAPRQGWQDGDANNTYAIAPVTARYFRFVYNKQGSEPGAEDLDAAKWRPSLKINGIVLSSQPGINQYEGKSGIVWRVGKHTTAAQLADSLCIPEKEVIDITAYMDANGQLNWNAPKGRWTILRIGHTSTGHTNATGGGGIGLECDKFNPVAIRLQFNSWFNEAINQTGKELASRVLTIFHVDSWECGSQNWSPVFREAFTKRRGYDPLPYLPVMAGIPVQDAATSEGFLHDIRQTIAELINDNFYATLEQLSHEKGFPTHDKPNDMLDAVSGAHIYGKPIIQAEAFTTDRNYALGANRLVYHVFTHNPWMDRKPGMTLDGVGLYFQRDQTWWKAGKAWIDYAQRCQVLLQRGKPVVDLAVFTGEEIPSRSILPDRLVTTLPGIFGQEKVAQEERRVANYGAPMAEQPTGVRFAANTYKAEDWIDPLHGYQYDCINTDALLRLATVRNGKIVLPGGASYSLLIIPASHPMNPDASYMSVAVAKKLLELKRAGATILIAEKPQHIPGMPSANNNDNVLHSIVNQLWNDHNGTTKGKIIKGIYKDSTFDKLHLPQDLVATSTDDFKPAKNIAWNHRREGATDIYFRFQSTGNEADTTGKTTRVDGSKVPGNTTIVILALEPNASAFIILSPGDAIATKHTTTQPGWRTTIPYRDTLYTLWTVQFDQQYGGPSSPVTFPTLTDWSKNADSSIRYYSGTAVYTNTVTLPLLTAKATVSLSLGTVNNIAEVTVNGIYCGTAWTYPYTVNISKAIHAGTNQLSISVANTWANRLIGDQSLPDSLRITHTTAPFRLQNKPLLPAGLLGPITVEITGQ